MWDGYRALFSIDEIESSPVLRAFYWALLLGFFVTFHGWVAEPHVTVEVAAASQHKCWPYFQDCGDLYFLSALPRGYSQTTLYMVAYAVMLAAAAAAVQGRWVVAHALMLPLYAWKVLVYLVLTMSFVGNFHHFHLALATVFLFLPYRLYFLRVTMVVLYFLSATVKLDEGWVLGTYFSSLERGLPLLPDALIPVATNAVIFLETIVSWFLLSPHPRRQRAALAAFVVFHLYSITLVKFMYPTMCLVPLLVLFGPREEAPRPGRDWRAAPGWGLVVLLFAAQSVSHLIPGDTKWTLEGNTFGLYMFEANHQCVSVIGLHRPSGHVERRRDESPSARDRCDPYRHWFHLRSLCRRNREEITRIAWTFDHSVNGAPFRRIVDVPDACALAYRAAGRNEWIRLPADAPVVGTAVRNFYE